MNLGGLTVQILHSHRVTNHAWFFGKRHNQQQSILFTGIFGDLVEGKSGEKKLQLTGLGDEMANHRAAIYSQVGSNLIDGLLSQGIVRLIERIGLVIDDIPTIYCRISKSNKNHLSRFR